MKYKKTFKFTNLIITFLVVCISLSLCACQNNAVDPDAPTEFTVEMANELVRQDSIATKIFICNGLCGDGQTLEYEAVSEDSQYSSYEEIVKLLDATYLPESGQKENFLNYPPTEDKALIEREGKTYVFKHPGSGFYDYILPETVAVSETEDDYKKLITGSTESGKEITLTAVYHEQKWLLEKGIYDVYEHEPFKAVLPNTGLGSLSDFTGNVLVIKFFITDLKTEFTQEEEDAFGAKIENAVNFIKDEAKRHGSNVNVDFTSAYFHHNGFISDRILDFDTDFAETGFGTLKKFAESNYDLSKYDNYFFVVCFNKEMETSFEYYDGTKETSHYYGERVCIGTAATEYEICVSVMSLLGAVDYTKESDEYLISLYRHYFPDDVFLKDTLENAIISDYNAYACGIKNDLENIYRVFNYEK